ncbi:hypothetical protein [Halalkalibacter urbisdiaboli]|uniref:hypothetical protein n=1 Tax=Halalkalibacter urbisdiaboli TaxID=1960589 RepID=UPI000B43B409|nr:hypothetical protein [Halalkalibacter urbisdiaboli]
MNTLKKLTNISNYDRHLPSSLGIQLSISSSKTGKIFSEIGVWMDGHLSWLTEKEWDLFPSYYEKGDLTISLAYHLKSNLHITLLDQADESGKGILRKILIKNQSNSEREVRIVFYQKSGMESGSEKVTFYSPISKALIHHFDGEYTMVSGSFGSKSKQQFAAGDPKSTWNEAKGTLHLLPISHQSTESMFTARLRLAPWGEKHGCMWMLHDQSIEQLHKEHERLLYDLESYSL